MAKDVEMADAPAPAADDDKDKAPPPFDVAQGVAKNVGFVRKAVEGAQPRLLARALRNTTPIRRKCTGADLANAMRAHLPADARVLRDAALSALGPVDVDMADADEIRRRYENDAAGGGGAMPRSDAEEMRREASEQQVRGGVGKNARRPRL